MAVADRDTDAGDERIALGRIGRAHGLKGAFRVWPYADDHERFKDLKAVTLTREEKSLLVTVEKARLAPGHVVVKTSELTSPEDVRPWIGGDIEVEESQRITLPAGQYFHDQIVGLRVRSTSGDEIGEIVKIIEAPANDVYVCSDGERQHLIPAVDEFVKKIDLTEGVMTIAVIPGLLTE